MEAMLANLTFGMNVRDAAFRSALATDRAELQRTERQFRQSGDGMTAAMQDAAREINRAALAMIDSLSRAADKVRNAGLIMTAALTVPLAAAGKTAKDTASDFQVAMNKVQAAMLDASPEQLNKLRDAALELGPAYGKSAIEAAGAIENLAKNGMDAASILGGGLAGALALGVVGQTNLGDAADATTDILQQFHISAGQLPSIVDKVSGALDASKLSFDGYKDAIGQVGGIAGGLGYRFEDMNTALAAVVPLMTGGADAGTSFKTFLLALVPQSKDAADVMDKLGLSFFNANGSAKSLSEVATQLNEKLTPLTDKSRQTALTKMFGTDGMRVAIALMQAGAKGIADVQSQIDKASANQKMAVLLDGEAAATQRVASAWEKLKIVVGEAGIIQAFTMVKEATASVLSVLAGGPPWFYKIMVAVGLFAASLGPLTLALLQVAKIGLPLLLLRLGPVALGMAAIINPMGVLIRLLGQLALQAGAAAILGRLGTAMIGFAGPIGLVITALTVLVPLLFRKREASMAAQAAVDAAREADRRSTQTALELASATDKARAAILEKAKADRIAALDAVAKAKADMAAARAAYTRAKADADRAAQLGPTDSEGGIGVAQTAATTRFMQASANFQASMDALSSQVRALDTLNKAIGSASAGSTDREFRANEKPGILPSVRADELAALFPGLTDTFTRKRLKLCADLKKGAWVKRVDFRIPSEEELRRMLSPENVCSYESMQAGLYRLKRLGISRLIHPVGLSTAMNQLPDEAITLAAASHIERELQITSWNLTSNFVSCTNQDRENIERLEITGVGDPSGRGLGFSYVRVTPKAPIPSAVLKKKVSASKGGSTVTGTDADLRRLSMDAAREVLLKFKVPEEQINKLTRWHRIALVRKLSSEQAASGVKVEAMTLSKFARGQRMSFLQLQQQTREKCQEIWDRQVQSLSAANDDENDSDSEANSDLDSFAGDLENLLDAEECEDEAGSDAKVEKADVARGLKMRRCHSFAQTEEEIEDDEAEAAAIRRLLDDDESEIEKKKKPIGIEVSRLQLGAENAGSARKLGSVFRQIPSSSRPDASYTSKEVMLQESKEVDNSPAETNLSWKSKAKKGNGKNEDLKIGLVKKKFKAATVGTKVAKINASLDICNS